MISIRPRRQLGAPGYTWVRSATSTPHAVRDLFGARPFSAHIASVGYDYDWHRGVDVPFAVLGDPVYAGMQGMVVRKHHTHFDFATSAQFTPWTETDAGAAAVFALNNGMMRITGSRVGAQTVAQAARFTPTTERLNISTDNWEVRAKLNSNPTMAGGVIGFGVFDTANDQCATIEYDGATSTVVGVHAAGAMAANGTTSAATAVYLSVTYTQSSDTITWRRSNDAVTWTTIATQATVAFSREGYPVFVPILYYRSTDTDAATNTIDVSFFGWYDDQPAGARFGNHVVISNGVEKVIQMHMQDLTVAIGDYVESGQLIGYAGATGFDSRSGNVLAVHCHLEYAETGIHDYSLAQPINPLGVGIVPRANVSNNVAVVRTTGNDPDAVDCHKLTITVTRADQDFDMNSIVMTGNTTTRTLNFNTRAGLEPTDNDIPKYQGVYLVPSAFDENSASYVLTVYASKAVIGATWVSGSILDTAGTTLWSD